MKTNDIIRAYTKGKLTAQEANGKLKEIGVNVRLVEGKNQLTAQEIAETHVGATPKEANGWGLLDNPLIFRPNNGQYRPWCAGHGPPTSSHIRVPPAKSQ